VTGTLFGGFLEIAFLLYALMTFVIHSLFAWAVDHDSRRLRRDGIEPVLVRPFVWALATFLGGPLVGAGYWVVHHSLFATTPVSRMSD
jgi:peptidoglycan biosynthesis protein MviN/MurJ (putative lipid II flippase)